MARKPKSESPFGKTMSISRQRLEIPVRPGDPETLMMRFWEKENVRVRWLNGGRIPLDLILHQCNEDCMPSDGIHHYTRVLEDRDVEVAAATVQWLATNCGREFLRRFFESIDCKVVYAPRTHAA